MLKFLTILTILSCALAAQAGQYVSVGTCRELNVAGEKPLRILLDLENQSKGLLVGEVSSPLDDSNTIMVAESIDIKSVGEDSFEASLSPTSPTAIATGTTKFSFTKEGANWKGKHRSFVCKVD